MAMQPVLTAILPPYIRGSAVQVVGHGFGRVASVALVDSSTHAQFECNFQVDTGYSIHFTVPTGLPDGTYTLLCGTLDGTVSVDDTGQPIVIPDDNPPVPQPGNWSMDNPIVSFSGPSYEAILARARLEAGDFQDSFSATVTGDGTTLRFDLPKEAISTTGLVVAIISSGGNVTVLDTTQYLLDADLGVITLPTPLPVGSTMTVAGTNWQFFGTNDWNTFLLSAALKHTHHVQDETAYRGANGLKFYTLAQQTIDTLPPVEYHPLALLAAIEALWVIATDASFDISVTTAEGTSIPREQRFSNVLQMIQVKTEAYQAICRQLNVGLDRIEVFTLRRVSRTTGRLVPVYREKEYDDYSLPERTYVHRDSGKTANDTSAPDPYYGGGGIYP